MATAPAFWWRTGTGPSALILWPISLVWGWSASRRMRRTPRFRPPVAVVCVGNYVVGGAGKTPASLALAKIARGRGLKPGFLASGFGGTAKGPLLVDPAIHDAALVGDEPLLLAASAPTVIGRDRAAGAKLLLEKGVSLIIMDDGFQNPTLAKDLSLVCVDTEVGLGNGQIMPSGPLRAPLDLQLAMTDAIVLIGTGDAAAALVRTAARGGKATLHAELKPVRVREWRQGPLLAFAGIGRPGKFFASLTAAKATVAKTVEFPDHHRFSEADATRLIEDADRDGLRLVTTEKDKMRLTAKSGKLAELGQRADAFPIVLEFDNPAAIGELIGEAVRRVAEMRGR